MGHNRILLMAAHPDDEVIGAGIEMTRWNPSHVTILHVTDGSPEDPKHAQAAGFATRGEYAKERRRELGKAMELAGMAEARCVELGYTDQQAHLYLPDLVATLTDLIDEIRPDVIYTHPYEGGHPDHDAAAFGANHAVAEFSKRGGHGNIAVMEFTSYHAGPDGLVTSEFLQSSGARINSLTASQRALKTQMFQCFRSQEAVLRQFPIVEERFRSAPAYNFAQPPHSGPLHYETLGWNITGEHWRRHAVEAIKVLQGRQAG
ncbi:MAG: PIG-L family deacetylase [Acidobacteriota bacterium]|nr:PIG-L family deacetylase [Acidobacteriota bacterium]